MVFSFPQDVVLRYKHVDYLKGYKSQLRKGKLAKGTIASSFE
jgi:hypothetical protein